MAPPGRQGFSMQTSLLAVEQKPGAQHPALALPCLMDGVICMVARVLAPEQKRGWNVAGKQTGDMADVPLKLYAKEKNQWR